jgi:hypothetical protein
MKLGSGVLNDVFILHSESTFGVKGVFHKSDVQFELHVKWGRPRLLKVHCYEYIRFVTFTINCH